MFIDFVCRTGKHYLAHVYQYMIIRNHVAYLNSARNFRALKEGNDGTDLSRP